MVNKKSGAKEGGAAVLLGLVNLGLKGGGGLILCYFSKNQFKTLHNVLRPRSTAVRKIISLL